MAKSLGLQCQEYHSEKNGNGGNQTIELCEKLHKMLIRKFGRIEGAVGMKYEVELKWLSDVILWFEKGFEISDGFRRQFKRARWKMKSYNVISTTSVSEGKVS
ncbi:hypothetical protein CEXT_144821 [Caerostris extrusa]|uniref:Uncharacterized protein n=1 Tax=Caerostris extrusa TaxID=172846 RepID=A0AAV4X2D4_CAEEX|nr:hypothetical protein CEXT_144821 [Caerostris extrusa]